MKDFGLEVVGTSKTVNATVNHDTRTPTSKKLNGIKPLSVSLFSAVLLIRVNVSNGGYCGYSAMVPFASFCLIYEDAPEKAGRWDNPGQCTRITSRPQQEQEAGGTRSLCTAPCLTFSLPTTHSLPHVRPKIDPDTSKHSSITLTHDHCVLFAHTYMFTLCPSRLLHCQWRHLCFHLTVSNALV